MKHRVTLVGLDFGTTTSSAVVATASLQSNAVTRRVELSQVRERFRSDMVFTPLARGCIDLPRLEAYLDSWLDAGAVRTGELFGGGALLTGLTAQRANAALLVNLVRHRLGDVLVATADDPCLESWLSFLGSCGSLSRAHPGRVFLNLDIGGGTTNVALGRDGQVLRTGCLNIGARHIEVESGTYRILHLSPYARLLLDHLNIRTGVSDTLTEADLSRVADFYVGLFETIAAGDDSVVANTIAREFVQVPFHLPADVGEPIVTFSGGVGELIYQHLNGIPWPPTTHFGDLGIEMARRLVLSDPLGRHLRTHVPEGRGRATALGLLHYSTEISGSTLFLPRHEVLPLADLPVLGSVSPATSDADLVELLRRVKSSPRGGCLFVSPESTNAARIRAIGGQIAAALRQNAFPPGHPLVLLVQENVGKVLGHYATDWGRLAPNLVVLDEVPMRDAHYVQIGRLRQQVVPITFHGLFER